MKYKYASLIIILLFAVTCLSSCAPEHYSASRYGFFYGLLHGVVIIFALIGKLIGLDVGIYAQHNTGFTYWLGFIIGIGALGGGASRSRR